jgi:hypothetical protein
VEISDLVLLPEVDVRAALGASIERIRLLVPPVASYGVGTLRALRVREISPSDLAAASDLAAENERAAIERDVRYELVAGYDRYEPLVAAGKRAS